MTKFKYKIGDIIKFKCIYHSSIENPISDDAGLALILSQQESTWIKEPIFYYCVKSLFASSRSEEYDIEILIDEDIIKKINK